MSEERSPQAPEPEEQQPEPQPGPEPVPQQEPVEQPQPERSDWRDRRIGEQQQRLRERNARIAELEARLRGFEQPANQQPQPGQQQPQFGQSDIQRQIQEMATQMAAQQEFTRRCNDVAEAGRKVYNNFDNRVQRLVGLVDANDPQQVQAYNDFLNAAMETGQASRLIYELGGDLNEASRIMAMNSIKMAVELTKMSARAGASETSQAPRPLNPMATAGTSNRQPLSPDNPDNADVMSMEDWMKAREEQIASRRQRTLG